MSPELLAVDESIGICQNMNTSYDQFRSYLGQGQLSIFLFHGVTTTTDYQVRNYTRKHISKESFHNFCQSFSRWGTAISLNDVLEIWESGSELPPNAFAITFDDGFANNHTIACPILADFKLPATFYVTTGFLDSHTPSWIDAIEIALEKTTCQEVNLDVVGGVVSIRSSSEKQQLLNAIRHRIKSSSNVDPLSFSYETCLSLGVDVFSHLDPDLDRKLTSSEVAAIASDPLFEVGGHSHTHRILSFLDMEELQLEVSRSLDILTPLLVKAVIHYSYPEGQPDSYNESVISLLKQNGIEICPTAIHGTNYIGDDLFSLKRIAMV